MSDVSLRRRSDDGVVNEDRDRHELALYLKPVLYPYRTFLTVLLL